MWHPIRALRKCFADAAANRELRRHHETQRDAIISHIDQGDCDAIHRTLDDTRERENFVRANHTRFLRRAIRTDNVDTFKVIASLVEYKDNALPSFSDHSRPAPGAGFYRNATTPILVDAIQAGAEQVALHIAENHNVDVAATGKSTVNRYHDGGFLDTGRWERKTSYTDKPCDLAEKKGMTKLAGILLEKEAKALTARAHSLQPA